VTFYLRRAWAARWIIVLWTFSVLMGGFARHILQGLLEVWSPAGTLAVNPALFVAMDLVPIIIAGALFFAAMPALKPHAEDVNS